MSKKITSEFLENILHKQNSQTIWKPFLNRDFGKIYMDELDYRQVCLTPGEFRPMYATGSGMHTTWFFYHSLNQQKLFMIWITETNHGYRDDIERIEIQEDFGIPSCFISLDPSEKDEIPPPK